MDDINLMQAQLGLLGSGGSVNPLGIPTPAPPSAPDVRSPGDIAAEASQRAMATAYTTMQVQALSTPGAGAYSLPSSPALDAFAQQYRMNSAAIYSQQFNPYVAQTMAGMGGMGGFTPGMLPSPTSMTPAGMGIFRAPPPPPSPSVHPVPRMPLVQTPFTPQLPSPQFQTPSDYGAALNTEHARRMTAAGLAAPGVVARAGVDIGYGVLAGSAGAALGAAIGGPPGAVAGMLVGTALGAVASEKYGLGETAQGIVDKMNPFRMHAMRTQQIRGMSQGFVNAGPGLDMATGRGLGARESARLATMIETTAMRDPEFSRETGNMFSTNDLMRITQQAGERGLLDMAQRPEQIATKVKSIAKAVKNFMRMANESDMTEAMNQIAKLNTMGLSPEAQGMFLRDARMYSRMAGTSVKDAMNNGGLQGAMVFTQQGLSAGLGMQVGMAAHGMARQAVAAGTYTPQQLALLGGTQGIAQREMESNLAMLKQPMMVAAMSQIGAGGTFGLKGKNVAALLSGGVNIDQMASMGAQNIFDAVSKHGVGALGMLNMQQSELEDSLGRALGPTGMHLMKMNQVRQTMGMLGLEGEGGFATAAQALGMDAQTAKQLMQQASSPEYFKNLQRHLQRRRVEARYDATVDADENQEGPIRAAIRRSDFGTQARGTFRDFERTVTGLQEEFSSYFDSYGDDDRYASKGMYRVRGSDMFKANSMEERLYDQIITPQDEAAYASNMQQTLAQNTQYGALYTTASGRRIGVSETLATARGAFGGGDYRDLARVRQAQGGLAAVFGGGLAESFFRMPTNIAGTANILSGGSVFMTGAETEQLRADYEKAFNDQNRVDNMSTSEKVESVERIANRTNMSVSAVETAQSNFANFIAKTVIQDASSENLLQKALLPSRKYTGSDRDKMYAEFIKQNPQYRNMSRQDFDLSFNEAKLFLDPSQSERLVGGDMTSAGSRDNLLQVTQEKQDELANTLTGNWNGSNYKYAGLVGGGLGFAVGSYADNAIMERKHEGLRKIFASDTSDKVVTALALLRTKTKRGDAMYKELVQKGLSTEEKDRLAKIQKNGELQEYDDTLLDLGKRLVREQTTDDALTVMSGGRKEYYQNMMAMRRTEGLGLLLKDPTLTDKYGGDTESLLRHYAGMSKDALEDKGLSGGMRRDIADYGEAMLAGDRKAMQAIASKVNRKAARTATGDDSFLGGLFSSSEKNSDAMRDAVGDLAGDMSEAFPRAVDTFQEASKALLDAANRLGGGAGGFEGDVYNG